MASIYHRALGLAAAVLVTMLTVSALALASSAAFENAHTALRIRASVEAAQASASEFRRTRVVAHADSALAALRRGQADARRLRGDVSSLAAALRDDMAAVTRLRALLTRRGLTPDAGVEGHFRARVHAVEASIERQGETGLLVPMLQARRREKDFMLRTDYAYVAQVQRHVAEATAAARTRLRPNEADAVGRLLRDYEAGFLDLVRITAAVQHEASRLDRAGSRARAAAATAEAAAARRARQLQWLSLVAALGGALLVCIAAVIQARGIARPIARLRDASVRIAAGATAVHVPETGPAEVRTLAAVLNGVAAHVDRRAVAERELAEAKRFTDTVLGHAQEGVIALDADYRIVYANPYAERLYGTTFAAVEGRRPDDLFGYIRSNGRLEMFARAMAGEVVASPDIAVEIGGRTVWITASYAPLAGADGTVRGVVATVHDVTDRVETAASLRAAKDAAEDAARLKSSLLANMSHEIRTPLTGILGYADLLADEATPEIAAIVEVIQRSGQRLLETLNSVLDIAQLESGTMSVGRVPVDASAMAASTVELFAQMAARKNVRLAADADPGVRVLGDAAALGRVMANLVSNAVKFTDCGEARLRVTVADGGERPEVLVEVSDTGIGMSDDFMGRIFGEFQQESEGHARSHEGTGLGLAIVRRLVERMDGRIAVASIRGEGSTFRVWLPAAAVPAALVPAALVPALT